MRVGVIRTDLPSPILLADLEQVSRRNVPTEAPGQETYISYPTEAAIQAAIDDTGASGFTAADVIAAVYPTPTTIDVSDATITGIAGFTSPDSDATVAAIAAVVAPQFAETDVAIESFLVGNISQLRNAAYSYGGVAGEAVAVVEDDGSTDFATAHTLPTLTTADLGTPVAGAMTLTGTGLGKESGNSKDPLRSTRVKLTGAVSITLHQEQIEAAGGSVADTSIVIPASLIPGATTTTTSAQVQFRQRVSAIVALT